MRSGEANASSRGEATWDYLVELIGWDAAEKLSVARGGRGIHIPAEPGEHSPLVQIVGAGAARVLAGTFAGCELSVASGPGIRAEVRRLKAAGRPVSQIAAALRRTERFVYKVLAENTPDAPPPEPPPLLARMGGR
jgi:hypothetical protein